MTFKDFFSPLSNKKIKQLLLISAILIIIAVVIRDNKMVNEQIPTEIIVKEEKSLIEEKSQNEGKIKATEVKNVETVKDTMVKPEISAEEYLVGDIETGEIYLQKNIDKVFPIASISKLITAVVAVNILDKDKEISITSKMLEPYGDSGKLSPGEIYAVDDLLYPLLMESSNDTAEAIAISYGYDEFIKQMNSLAYEIGMEKTSFEDPSGLSYINSSNVKDLFVLAKYIYNYEKSLLNITKKTNISIASTTGHIAHDYNNINPLSSSTDFIGGKTGRTNEAKESMLSIFNPKIGDKVYTIAIIVLRSEFNERENDTMALLQQFIDSIK